MISKTRQFPTKVIPVSSFKTTLSLQIKEVIRYIISEPYKEYKNKFLQKFNLNFELKFQWCY